MAIFGKTVVGFLHTGMVQRENAGPIAPISSYLKDILGQIFAGRYCCKSQWDAMGSCKEAGQAVLCC